MATLRELNPPRPAALPPQAYGVVPVLFASQWFLTAFSCPFPVHFACRLVDVMAVGESGGPVLCLPRV